MPENTTNSNIARGARPIGWSQRVLATVGVTILSALTAYYFFYYSSGGDLGNYNLAVFGILYIYAMIVVGTFIVSLFIFKASYTLRHLWMGVALISFLSIAWPSVLIAINQHDLAVAKREEAMAKAATVVHDCRVIKASYTWSNCIRKTVMTQGDVKLCIQQAEHVQDPASYRPAQYSDFVNSCKTALKDYQQHVLLQQAADSVDGLKGCELFAQKNDSNDWKYCVSAKGVQSRADYDECYRQARLQFTPGSVSWPFGTYCGRFYKESFGH